MKKIITPRPYQAIAVKAAFKALRKYLKALVVMATGLGKTITAAMIAKALRSARILFLVHNNFILDHALKEFRLIFGDDVKMAVYNGHSKKGAEDARIVFATWQTMGGKLKSWDKDHFDLVIVDEAHHTEAETYAPTVRHFTGKKLGITATPDRNDDEDIRAVFGKEVVNISLEEAIARGWLPKIEYHIVTDESLDNGVLEQILKEIKGAKRRYSMAEINRRLFIRRQANAVAKTITSYGESSLVFCKDIDHADKMAEIIPHAKAFHSGKDEEHRTTKQVWNRNQKILTEFRTGNLSHVTAVNAFNEGVDVPAIGLIALLRQHGYINGWRQQIGRGLRPGAGKKKLTVLDFVSNLERMQLILETVKRIKELEEKFSRRRKKRNKDDIWCTVGNGERSKAIEVSGEGFTFKFTHEIVDLMQVLAHCQREVYPTWQEASVAVQKLGIKGQHDYEARYREDERLHGSPRHRYLDFPGWKDFCGTGKYTTWQQASVAAIELGCVSRSHYSTLYRKDGRLPRNLVKTYSNFPGWAKFLAKKKRGIPLRGVELR